MSKSVRASRFARLVYPASLALATAMSGIGSPAVAETRALLAGVWQFGTPVIPDLKGPEHDLAAMEVLVRTTGATDVTVLRNDQVTRTTMETALHALGMRSKPGDWIVLYYSGHGAQAEAAVKGTRDGDLDQFLPLAGFDPDQQDVERFIVDKDFYDWLSRYVPTGVRVLMVADTCHSGTMNRSVDARAFHFTPRVALRAITTEMQLIPRPAPRFPSVLNTATRDAGLPIEREDLVNLVFIGAAQDGQLALESSLPDEGALSRGLLTFALEQGLARKGPDGTTALADLNGDGKIAVSEIAVYLDGQVRTLSAQRQQPRSTFSAARASDELMATSAAALQPLPARPPLPGVYSAEPKAQSLLALPDVPWDLAKSSQSADFIWDYTKRTLIRRTGDVVAQGISTTAALRGVVEKWNTLESLRPLLNEAQGKLEIGPNGASLRYKAGSRVSLSYRGLEGRGGFATIFNLASDGTVQVLYPSAPEDGDGQLGEDGHLTIFQNQVVAPFGTDHIIALVTPVAPKDLRALLHTLDNQRAPLQTVEPIRQQLARNPGKATLSIAEIYTGE